MTAAADDDLRPGRAAIPCAPACTFFLTGSWARTFPEHARALGGYTVGNHTYDHPDLTTLESAAVRTQVRRAERDALPGVIAAVRARGCRLVELGAFVR